MSWWVWPLALVVGVLMGTLGGGGAILTVPILTGLVGQSPHQATAGSLVIVGLSSLVGMASHARAGRVRVGDGVTFGLLGVVGALVGSRLSASVPAPILMTSFAVLLSVVAGLMFRKRFRGRKETTQRSRGWLVRIAAATGVGLLAGFFGVGGGFVIVPALTLVMGLPMEAAVGTSLLVIAINSVTSLVARAVQGLDLNWHVVVPFAVLMVIGTLIGARVSQRIDAKALTLGFAILLVLVAVAVAAQNVPQLFH